VSANSKRTSWQPSYAYKTSAHSGDQLLCNRLTALVSCNAIDAQLLQPHRKMSYKNAPIFILKPDLTLPVCSSSSLQKHRQVSDQVKSVCKMKISTCLYDTLSVICHCGVKQSDVVHSCVVRDVASGSKRITEVSEAFHSSAETLEQQAKTYQVPA